MGKMLLGLAATLAAIGMAAPATAGGSHRAFTGSPNAKATVGTLGGTAFSGGGPVGFGDGRFDRRFDADVVGESSGVWVNSGQWALYNNRTFSSDSYNDWWHDRPDRAYPAWMRNNQNCQRQWYAGNMLRC